MRRCEDEKMFYRPPLLEEPCAQTLSGKTWFWVFAFFCRKPRDFDVKHLKLQKLSKTMFL
jgi:hypothetical protein